MWEEVGFDDEDEEQDQLTVEDLEIDESLDDVDRIVEYSTGHVALQRLVHVRMLGRVAKSVGFHQTIEKLVPVLVNYKADEEYKIRKYLAVQIHDLVVICHNASITIVSRTDSKDNEPYVVIIEKLLPILGSLVADSHEQVRSAAGRTFGEIMPLIHESDRMPVVASHVLKCAVDHHHEELRITAVAILNRLAPLLGSESCSQFLVPVVVSLSEDPIFRVRKAVALNIDQLFHTLEPHLRSGRLLPAFLALGKDNIWGVRKACIETVTAISCDCNLEERSEYLIPFVMNSFQDRSKWVKIAAYQNFGQFLSTLESSQLSDSLLDMFLRMESDNTLGTDSIDVQLSYFTAFSLPGVLLAAGSDRWDRIQPRYLTLTKDASVRVRRTLAFSLHKVCEILGPELADKSLCPVFESFLSDVDEVKVGIISHLIDFIKGLPSTTREAYIPLLADIQLGGSPLIWRYRKLLADQLCDFVQVLSPKSVSLGLIMLVFNAVDDGVQIVRESAMPAVADLMNRCIQENDTATEEVVRGKLSDMANSSDFSKRQAYILICESLSERLEPEAFLRRFGDKLKQLGDDKVSNVRLTLAKVLMRCEQLDNLGISKPLLDKLIHDRTRDVAVTAGSDSKTWEAENLSRLKRMAEEQEHEQKRLKELAESGLVDIIPASVWPIPEPDSVAPPGVQPDAS